MLIFTLIFKLNPKKKKQLKLIPIGCCNGNGQQAALVRTTMETQYLRLRANIKLHLENNLIV